jgi:enoyl-CoA hydratase/carnithine racemase
MGELIVEEHDEVAVATMSNVARHNAQDSAMHAQLRDFWLYLKGAEHLKVAVITGDGDKAFSSGLDLKEVAEQYTEGKTPYYDQEGRLGYPHLFPTGKVLIAAINGYCFAGGLLTSLGCHLRLCSETAVFGNPQVRRGRGSRVPMLLHRAGVPMAVALDLMLTGDRIDAERAYQIGLVSRIFQDKDALLDGAFAIARQIALNSPRAVSAIVRAWEAGIIDWPMSMAWGIWDQVTEAMVHDDDYRERTLQFASGEGPGSQKA